MKKKSKKTSSSKDVGELSFNDIPHVLGDVLGSLQLLEERTSKLESISQKITKLEKVEKRVGTLERHKNIGNRKWLNVEQLMVYLPSQPSKQTVYAWMRDNKIPYYKSDKECHFLTTEIDEWLSLHPNLTKDKMQAKAEQYIKSHPLKK